MRAVKTTIKCDGCKALIVESCPGSPEYAYIRMVTHGYGMMDGDHRERWDICSPECGLKVLKKYIREIETAAP